MRVALVVFALLAVAAAEVPNWSECSESSKEMCSVAGVRVEPCKANSYCRFKKGKDATMDIDYVPNFSGDDIVTGLYWASPSGDVPFDGLNEADACAYTTCPVTAGQQSVFHYSLHISKKLPDGKFPLKWKLWKKGNPAQPCCLSLDVKLVK